MRIQEAVAFLREHLEEGDNFVLLLLGKAGPHTQVAYASSLERTEGHRAMMDVVASHRSHQEPRVMGEALGAVPDGIKIAMFEMLSALKEVSADKLRVSPQAWRDLFLVFCVNEAHDQGITRADFERCAIEAAQEEWSTPDTAGRVAVNELLAKVKPQPIEPVEECREPCGCCGAPKGTAHRSPLCR